MDPASPETIPCEGERENQPCRKSVEVANTRAKFDSHVGMFAVVPHIPIYTYIHVRTQLVG